MTTRTRLGITLAVLCFAVAALLLAATALRANPEEAELHKAAFTVMSTVAQFSFYGSPEETDAAIRAGMDAYDRITRMCNVFDPGSELSRLNASAAEAPFVCSQELWELLAECRRAYEFSDGAFDITILPAVSRLWNLSDDVDSPPDELMRELDKIGLSKVVFDDAARSVFFTRPGMALDLGGIAKGYAVDLATEAALAAGVRRGVVDLGGNLRLLPEPPPGRKSYRIGVRTPDNSGELSDTVLELLNTSLSTSGNYERYIEIGGEQYGHILDPRTGRPTPNGYSVTVIAPSAMVADWLSTAIYVEGPGLARKAEHAIPGVTVFYNPAPTHTRQGAAGR